MKILWLPLCYVSIPWVLAMLLVKLQWIRKNTWRNRAILFVLIILAFLLTYLSFVTSISGMKAKGIKSLTGAVVFPPIGIGSIIWYYSIMFKKKAKTTLL